MSAWKPSEADERRMRVFDVTMDTELAGLATLPQAHAIALQKVIESELAIRYPVVAESIPAGTYEDPHSITIPEGDAWPFDQ